MRKLICCILPLLILFSCKKEINTQNQSSLLKFGGNSNDFGRYIIKENHGNLIIYGATNGESSNGFDIHGKSSLYAIKTDAQGNLIWEKTFSVPEIFLPAGVAQLKNGNYVFAANIDSLVTYNKAHIFILDNNGQLLWEKDMQRDSKYMQPQGIKSCADGGFAIAYTHISHEWKTFGGLIKYGETGNILWEYDLPDTLSNGILNLLNDVVEMPDGSFLVTGSIDMGQFSQTKKDVLLVHISHDGKMLSYTISGGPLLDVSAQIKPTKDGGFAVLGITTIAGKSSQVLLTKLNDAGKIEWQKNHGGEGDDYFKENSYDNYYDQFHRPGLGFDVCKDGSFIITSNFNKGLNYASPGSATLLKLDAQGNKMWQKNYGGNQASNGNDVVELNDGSYAVTGFTTAFGDTKNGKDLLLLLTDKDGNLK